MQPLNRDRHPAQIEAEEATRIGPLGWALGAAVFLATLAISAARPFNWFAGWAS